MKHLRYLSIVCAVICLFTCGCRQMSSGEEAVSTVSPEELTEIAEELSEHTGDPDKLPDAEAYWTEGGGVYHTSRDCGHLSRAKTVISGTIDEALAAGKAKICSTCAKHEANETEGQFTTETLAGALTEAPTEADSSDAAADEETTDTPALPADGTVYWTKSGSVYHSHEDCSHLRNSKSVLSGTVEEAEAAGKPRLCSTCAKADE